MVLYIIGTTNFNHVSISSRIYFKGKMVSIFFYDGSHLGKSDFIRNGFLLRSAATAEISKGKKLHAGVKSHVNGRYYAYACDYSKSVCLRWES